MLQAHSRWLVLAGISCVLSLACSDDGADSPGSSAGASGSSAGSNQQGGSSSGSGGASSTAGTMSTSGSAGSSGAATGGGGQGGGNGGASSGTGGGGGASSGTGGGSAEPTAVANITGVGPGAGKVLGTATFTQGAEMTKLGISLSMCPDGEHASHLHENKNCGNNGTDAGNHWVPNGEDLGNYVCAGGKATREVSKPKAMWTVGDGADTDVTKYSFMVHEKGDPSPGGRIGCGLIDKK